MIFCHLCFNTTNYLYTFCVCRWFNSPLWWPKIDVNDIFFWKADPDSEEKIQVSSGLTQGYPQRTWFCIRPKLSKRITVEIQIAFVVFVKTSSLTKKGNLCFPSSREAQSAYPCSSALILFHSRKLVWKKKNPPYRMYGFNTGSASGWERRHSLPRVDPVFKTRTPHNTWSPSVGRRGWNYGPRAQSHQPPPRNMSSVSSLRSPDSWESSTLSFCSFVFFSLSFPQPPRPFYVRTAAIPQT